MSKPSFGRLLPAPENYVPDALAEDIASKGLDATRRNFLRKSFAAASAALAWQACDNTAERRRVLALFGFNALLNIVWSGLYFGLHRPDWALIEVVALWLSIVALLWGLWPISRWASVLHLPYLAWVTTAAFLNLATVQLNGPFA